MIATGGGAVLRAENIQLLRENGRIYFIDRPLEDIPATQDRPLSSNREDLRRRYEERYPLYFSACDCHVKSSLLENTIRTITEDFNDEIISA